MEPGLINTIIGIFAGVITIITGILTIKNAVKKQPVDKAPAPISPKGTTSKAHASPVNELYPIN